MSFINPFQSLLTWQDIAQDPTLIDASVLHYIETEPASEPTKRSIVLTETVSFRSRSMELIALINLENASYALRLAETNEGEAFIDLELEYIELIIDFITQGTFIPLHNVDKDDGVFDLPFVRGSD